MESDKAAFEMVDATGAVDDLPTVNPPAFYAPLLWPFLYVYEGIRSPDKLRVAKPISMSHLGLFDNILSFVASLRSFLMAYTGGILKSTQQLAILFTTFSVFLSF